MVETALREFIVGTRAAALSDVEVVFPNDATAIITYRVKQEIAPRGTGKCLIQEMNDTSTWVHSGTGWKCVMHTETPAESRH